MMTIWVLKSRYQRLVVEAVPEGDVPVVDFESEGDIPFDDAPPASGD